MGISNIRVLIDPVYNNQARRVQAAQEAAVALLVADHRHGKHPWGAKRRACPLCQAGK